MKKSHSVGAILINREGKVAIVKNIGGTWTLPKGHIEEGESKLKTLSREIREETGITDVLCIKELGTYERPRSGSKTEIKVITIFLCLTDETILNPQDPENPEARWIYVNDVDDHLTHPKDKEFYNSVKPEAQAIANIERDDFLQALDEMEENQKRAEANPEKEKEFRAEYMYSNPGIYHEIKELYIYYGYVYSHALWQVEQIRYILASLEDEMLVERNKENKTK